jgi:hypothetical protein
MNTYKYSGRITPLGVLAGALAGFGAGFPLAFVYAWGMIRIPEQHLAGIATLAYGAAIGAIVLLVTRAGKVRNVQILGALTLCAAAASFYCSWAFWVKDVFDTFGQEQLDSFTLMQQPQVLWNLMKLINQNGTWGTIADHPTKGVELWILWMFEAVAVLGAAAVTAVAWFQAQPFCETCQRWCSTSEKLFLSPVSNLAQTKLQLAQRDLTFLQKLGAGSKGRVHLSAELHACPKCRELNTLTLRQTRVPQSRFRSPHVTLVDKLLVSRAEADRFRQNAAGLKQQSKATHG